MSTVFGTIVGRVLGPADAPVPGASVAVVAGTQPWRDVAAITLPDGSFRFGGMRPGSYRVEARSQGSARSAEIVVVAGVPAGVEIRMEGGPPTRPEPLLPRGSRVRVTNNAQYPWRCVCYLRFVARDGTRTAATGWLAAPRLVITAGHCVYTPAHGGGIASVEVIPGCDGTARPFGSVVSTQSRASGGWIAHQDPDHDYGAILLPPDRRYGDQLGWFGYKPRDDEQVRQATLNLSGYPHDSGAADDAGTLSQWFSEGRAVQILPGRIVYDNEATEGQDGAPVWEMTAEGERHCVAIHASSTSMAGGGSRVTREAFDDIARWALEAP